MIRAFIAVDVPEPIRAAVAETQARLKRAPLAVRVSWVKVANLHLTLQFLGYLGEDLVEKISAALDPVGRRLPPFDWTLSGAGAFPSLARPRVVWVGGADPSGKLKELAAAVQEALAQFGFEPERREFSPHLTIGRVKFPRPDPALTKAVDSIKQTVFGTVRVEEFHLYQSQLHPEGSIYTRLSTHRLSGAD
jgi:RNA 2',3'-cyclic 3'-phosphodiesterase